MRAARAASRARSPRITRRAAKGVCAWRCASSATSSGPMPAGSPEVIANETRFIGAIASQRLRFVPHVAEELDLHAGCRAHDAIHDFHLRKFRHWAFLFAEYPQQLQRFCGVDFAGVLHGLAERQCVALAAENGELVKFPAIPDHLPAGEALAGVEVIPISRR